MEFEISIEDKAKTQSFTTHVKEVTGDEAPLAGRIRSRLVDEDGSMSFTMHPLRYHEGRLFGAMTFQGSEPSGLLSAMAQENKIPSNGRVESWLKAMLDRKLEEGSLGKARKAVHAEAAKMLIVDGEWYYETSEPRYEINVVGPGHNAGGVLIIVVDDYEPNISPKLYFSAKDYDAAKLKALSLATERGDTCSIGYLLNKAETDELERIEVLMPEAFGCDPEADHVDYDPIAAMVVEALGIPVRLANVHVVAVRSE